MHRSDSISTVAAALVKAQAKIGAAAKRSKNPFFKSNYASLGEVMAVCKGPLLEQGIVILQFVGHNERGNYLETVLLHESGEFISDQMQIACAKAHDPQALGSAISYARRYALQAAIFIPAVDDDGEKAMEAVRDSDKYNSSAEERQRRREEADRIIREEQRRSSTFQPIISVSSPIAGTQEALSWKDCKIHFGKHKDKRLDELPARSLAWYANEWLASKVNEPSLRPADKELMDALSAYKQEKSTFEQRQKDRTGETDKDNLPF